MVPLADDPEDPDPLDGLLVNPGFAVPVVSAPGVEPVPADAAAPGLVADDPGDTAATSAVAEVAYRAAAYP